MNFHDFPSSGGPDSTAGLAQLAARKSRETPGATVRLHHENSFSHFHHPDDGALEMHLNEGVGFSVFAFEPTKIWISGAKWELIGERISFSTRGLSNQGLGGMISIKSEAPVVLISQR